ncbi:hypothetical protein PilKf_00188 [Pillotina sp. SPG140]|jgi:hypothetical protein
MKKAAFLVVCVLIVSAFASAQTLDIDFQYNVNGPSPNNYLTFKGSANNFALATKDVVDAKTGASQQKSTALFSTGYQIDPQGKNAFPSALRGLLLFAVSPDATRTSDGLKASKASTGVITIDYTHRDTAYKLVTDNKGNFVLPFATKGNPNLKLAEDSTLYYWRGNLATTLDNNGNLAIKGTLTLGTGKPR